MCELDGAIKHACEHITFESSLPCCLVHTQGPSTMSPKAEFRGNWSKNRLVTFYLQLSKMATPNSVLPAERRGGESQKRKDLESWFSLSEPVSPKLQFLRVLFTCKLFTPAKEERNINNLESLPYPFLWLLRPGFSHLHWKSWWKPGRNNRTRLPCLEAHALHHWGKDRVHR